MLHLHQNMRLDTAIEAEKDFAKWQLDVGKGMHTDNESNILLPNPYHCRENTVASLIETIYPGITRPNLSTEYFAECTILCCLNKDMDIVNHKVLQEFPGQSQVFYSADSIPTSELSGEDDPLLNYLSNAPRSCARGCVCPRALMFCLVLLDYILAYLLALYLHNWQVYHTH